MSSESTCAHLIPRTVFAASATAASAALAKLSLDVPITFCVITSSLRCLTELYASSKNAGSGLHRGFAALANAHNLVENALRHFPLGGLGNVDDLVVGNDGHFIAIGVEADAFAGNVIHDDGIELLGGELLASIFEDVLGLRGEADEYLCLLAERNLLENVGSRFEFQSDWPFAFDFLRRGRLRAIVRDSRSLDDDGRSRQQIQHGITHLLGRFHTRGLSRSRRRQRGGSTDQQ